MSIIKKYKKSSILKAAINQTIKARENDGAKADQLFISAYQGFAEVVKDDLTLADALYKWGYALLHQAKTKKGEEAIKLYQDAIYKFNFCQLTLPDYLGAAIDGGVAYMEMASKKGLNYNDELYDLAKKSFDNAERIQQGSAAYNLACIYALRKQEKLCIKALELSKDKGSLPEVEEILNDADLLNYKDTSWFNDLIERINNEPELETVDENTVVYDVEGKVISKDNKRNKWKNPETEVDGVVYDIFGNVIRRVEVQKPTETKLKTNEKKEKPKIENKEFVGVALKTGFANDLPQITNTFEDVKGELS